jgi:hypothetical protein
MSIVIFLLVAIVILLCTPQAQRTSTLWGLIFIGGLIWVLVTLRIGEAILALGAALLAFLWSHWAGTFIVLGRANVPAGYDTAPKRLAHIPF